MTRTATLHLEPRVLRWARTAAGVAIEDTATYVGVSPEVVARWESTEATPTARQVELLADKYRRPVLSLLLAEAPSEPTLPVDFRRTAGRRRLGPEARIALRRARRFQRLYQEYVDRRQSRSFVLPAGLSGDAEASAAWAREHLSISGDEQLQWRSPDTALAKWRSAIEELGVLVFRLSLPIDELRAFSIPGDPKLIVYSSGDLPVAQAFSLLHEWCHLLIGAPGLCKPNELPRNLRGTNKEVFANAFAGAFLAPVEVLRRLEPIQQLEHRELDAMQAAQVAARMMSVSRSVVLRRLLRIELVTGYEYGRIVNVWRQQQRPRGGRHVEPAVRAVRELGQPFITAVLNARDRGLISDIDAAEHFSVTTNEVERVAELAAS